VPSRRVASPVPGLAWGSDSAGREGEISSAAGKGSKLPLTDWPRQELLGISLCIFLAIESKFYRYLATL
jgi:hypothetical protein